MSGHVFGVLVVVLTVLGYRGAFVSTLLGGQGVDVAVDIDVVVGVTVVLIVVVVAAVVLFFGGFTTSALTTSPTFNFESPGPCKRKTLLLRSPAHFVNDRNVIIPPPVSFSSILQSPVLFRLGLTLPGN
jgi:hypothetical protein